MIYSVEVKRSARKSLLALPRDAQQRIRTAIDELATNARPPGIPS
ncbi:MAG: hypothetical protein U9Q81_05015 [Pseudomonadota bacterium]|nr:hypothetical protein [Pseudomonadota bacterium]